MCNIFLLYNVSSYIACNSVVWRDDYWYARCESIYALLKDKDQVPNDVIDVLVLIMREQLLSNPLVFRKWAIMMCLCRSQCRSHNSPTTRLYTWWTMSRSATKMLCQSFQLPQSFAHAWHGECEIQALLFPLVVCVWLRCCWHCKPFSNAWHFPFDILVTNDGIWCFKGNISELCVEIRTGHNKFKDLPLDHVHDCPQQPPRSNNCLVFCMRYME